MRQSIIIIIGLLLLVAYIYIFSLCLWGKPLSGRTGNIGYLIAFHVLAVAIYFNLELAAKNVGYANLRVKSEFFFFLHGILISVFPYNGYLLAGTILMAAALIASAIRRTLNH